MVSVIIRHNLYQHSGLCVKNITKTYIFRFKARPLPPSNFFPRIQFLNYWKKSLYIWLSSKSTPISRILHKMHVLAKSICKLGSCWAEPSLCNFNHWLLQKGWGESNNQLGIGGKLRITIVIIQIIRQEQRKVLFNTHYSGCKMQIIQMVECTGLVLWTEHF